MGLIKSICYEPDTSDWAPHNSHLFEPQITDDEGEVPPMEESDWDADPENVPGYHARPPTPMKRQPRQPPKVIMLQPIRNAQRDGQ